MYSLHLQLLSLGVCSFFCGHATEVLQRLTSQTGRSRHGPGEALAAPVVAAIPGERFTACHRPRPARPTSRHQNAHGPNKNPPRNPKRQNPQRNPKPQNCSGLDTALETATTAVETKAEPRKKALGIWSSVSGFAVWGFGAKGFRM